MQPPQTTRLPKTPLCGKTFYLDCPLISGRVWDLFAPLDREPKAAVFFIHGGGWRGGSRSTYHPIIDELVKHEIICASTDYRLSGVSIVEQLADVRETYAHFLSALHQQGNVKRPIVLGSSAGAHLALLLALAKSGACGEKLTDDPNLQPWINTKPAGVVAASAPLTFQPWEEMFPAIWADMQRAARCRYEENPQLYRKLSPIEHIDSSSPAVLLMQAQNEHMFPNPMAGPFLQKARTCGATARAIEYKNAEHGFFYDVTRPCQQRALKDLMDFIEERGSSTSDSCPEPAGGHALL